MTSLTELCSICFINVPKYTCPRCGCQTCGLDCVKTHKKRAKCNGVRDPASYKKSSELATPASIDQDYNFITKLQRDVNKAEENVAERGITFGPAIRGRNARPSKSKLEIEYEACGVTVVKAPFGLTRSKQNKTHWHSKHKCVVWTVEWVLEDDQRVLANVQSGKTVLEALTSSIGKKGLQKKRKFKDDARDDDGRPPKEEKMRTELMAQQTSAAKPIQEKRPTDLAHPAEVQEGQETSRLQDAVQRSAVENTASQLQFYLHRPRTSSKWTCLIPVSPYSSISDILRGRKILEFPTIYARYDTEEQLVPPMITEKEYEEQHGIDVVPIIPAYDQEDAVTGIAAIPDHIDEGKVMEVLHKDLVG